MFLNLVKNDIQSKYASSFAGIAWAFIQPLMNLLVMWFVFQVGLKNGDIDNVPFIIWFAPASLAWQFFAETLASLTVCIKEYDYLVSQVNFNVRWIPAIKIASSGVIHSAFILFIYFLCAVYKLPFTVFSWQIWYYFFAACVLLLGLGWLLSAITLFTPDIQSIVNVIISVGFWFAPIVWNPENMSASVQKIIKINPFYYICTGYRDSVINHIGFWERGGNTAYFWIVTLFILFLGYNVFNKMKAQFDDVL